MRSFLKNSGYYLTETGTIIKSNLSSNIFSTISMGLIFFILTMVISGWFISSSIISSIQKESEISVYFKDGIDDLSLSKLVDNIKNLEGVSGVRVVDKEEAYSRMVDILGHDAEVLSYFDDNPFNPFIEVKIELNKLDGVLEAMNQIQGIDYIRDNKKVLDRLKNIASVFGIIGSLLIAAVGFSTLVIVSHIIRLGIHNNRQQINTLRLLGAPEYFIAIPFFVQGLMLSLGGGIISSGMSYLVISFIYGQIQSPLPFIPLPQFGSLVMNIIMTVLGLSMFLGVFGSYIGLLSGKKTQQ
jgi:cell division transport system permease protein